MDAGREIVDALARRRRVLLTGPVAPDGDSIGACLALARVLRRPGGPEVTVAGAVPPRYRWLGPTVEMVAEHELDHGYDAVVVLDGDRHRLHPEVERRFDQAELRGIVDHHGSTRPDGYTHWWLEPSTESTCGMLLRGLRRWGVPLDRELAELLYTGLVFDTGGFRHANTGPETHHLAAELLATGIDACAIAVRVLAERSPAGLRVMGQVLASATFHPAASGPVCVGRVPHEAHSTLVDGDLEGVVEALLNTDGTEVAALLLERAPGVVKYSLRSRGGVDVAALAHRLHPSGGGHPRAAGATFRGALGDAEHLLLSSLTAPDAR
ncbi:MAG: DHH family phosphoesterase [Myxococcota bacterium]